MKTYRFFIYVAILTMALSFPLVAQQRAGSDGERGRAGADGGGGASVGGRGISVGATSSAPIMSPSRSTGTGTSSSAGLGVNDRNGSSSGGGSFHQVPQLSGTSFYSLNSYYLFQDFLWNLRTRYMFNPYYFNRFTRNSEPLVTPYLLKLALKEPLSVSSEMILAVDELEAMVNDLQAGKPVRKEDISEKAHAIREMAKKIRGDNSLAFIDQRPDKSSPKHGDFENLGLDAVRQLRQMATDLNTQLMGMYNQQTTSTVSVQSLTQPSFESLSKGIEKLTKVIETSARRL